MSITLKWENRSKDRLLRKFADLAPEAQKNLEDAGGKSAREMAQMARSLVPVRTGALRESIAVTPPGGSPPRYSQGSLPRVPEGAWAISAGNERVRYAHLIEFGTEAHITGGRPAGTAHPGTRAQPFFWPSYRVMARRHKGRASRALSKAIKAAGK